MNKRISHSFTHGFSNYESCSNDIAFAYTEQHGLLNINTSPAMDIPIHDNRLALISLS